MGTLVIVLALVAGGVWLTVEMLTPGRRYTVRLRVRELEGTWLTYELHLLADDYDDAVRRASKRFKGSPVVVIVACEDKGWRK
jgi:hypothetical protein